MSRPLDDVLSDLRSSIEHDVKGGFFAPTDIVERAVDYLRDDAEAATVRPLAIKYTDTALAAHQLDQLTWPSPTDCDRLEAAFTELEQQGILARQNFACCQSCGHAEMDEEITRALDAGRDVAGYVFYHEQDTENAVDGGGVFLAYGALDEEPEAPLAVAQRAVETLRRHGLDPRWPGTADKRIEVPMVWRRRRSV